MAAYLQTRGESLAFRIAVPVELRGHLRGRQGW